MHLHEIERICPELAQRGLHLGMGLLAAAVPISLGGDEQFVPDTEFGQQVTEYRFGRAVHGCRVDHGTAQLREALQCRA